MKTTLLAVIFLFFMGLGIVSANVGIGVSPTKIVMEIEAGEKVEIPYIVFNTGDSPISVSFNLDGDIAQFSKLSAMQSSVLQPEPYPRELPIKNGESINIEFSPDGSMKPGIYAGQISAVGSLTSESQFGGSVGVATNVEITVRPAKSLLSRIPKIYLYLFVVITGVALLVATLRKMHYSISLKKDNASQ